MTEHGYALYNWRTRRRLEITREQIEQNIQLAISAMVELEAHVPHLAHSIEWERQWEEDCSKLFSTLPELSESPREREADDTSMGGCMAGQEAEDDVERCAVKVEGPGGFEENVAQIKQTFRDQGWTFIEIIYPINDRPTLFFRRPTVKS
jgi:hypothetical protein